MHHVCAGLLRQLWIEDRRQYLVLDVDVLERPVRDGRRVRHHRCDALSREPQHTVENQCVVGVVGALVMACGGERHTWVVAITQHRAYPRHVAGLLDVDPGDTGRRVRAAQDRNMSHPGGQLVHGVRLGAGHHPRRCRGTDSPLRGCRTADGRANRPVTGAPAQVAFQRISQIFGLVLGESGRRQHHSRGAKSALESRMADEAVLHGMQALLVPEATHGEDLGIGDAMRGHDARMLRCPVHQYRAGTAITGVATLFDLGVAVLAQEGTQALPGSGAGVDDVTVDLHRRPPVSS